MIRSTELCRLGDDIVPFKSYAQIDHRIKASPNVKARGTPVYRVGDLHQCVQADAGAHIEAGTSLSSGCVKFLSGQDNVKVNGIPVVRHDSKCMVNCNAQGEGGAKGKVITVEKAPPTTFADWARKWSQKLYVEPGAVKNAYDLAVQGLSNADNSWVDRGVFLLGATATLPLATAEEVSRGVLNIPSAALGSVPLADTAGQEVGMAADASLSGDERILAALGATRDFAFASLGLLNLAVAVKVPVDAALEQPEAEGVFVRPKGRNFRNLTAGEANEGFPKPPYKEGTSVQEYQLTEDQKFVRLYTDDGSSGQIGRWMMPESEIQGLTPEQIQDKFSLPQVPNMITDVNVPAGTTIRVGEAGAIPSWGGGGGTQVQIPASEGLSSSWYTNSRSLP